MTVSTATATDLITDAQLANYAKLILKVTGIRVSPQKKMLLSNRIRRRLKETGIESFGAYYKRLCRLSVDDPEWDKFLQEITTHETYLFRDEAHWSWFRDSYLPEISSDAVQGRRKKELRIWSAACSTGDEACTIACCIADRLMNSADWEIEILGTDIGIDAVKKAEEAVFGERAMRLVPDSFRRRFFKKEGGNNLWAAKPELRRWTKFRQHNLLDQLKVPPFDLIFLKNVLIYFDNEAKKTVAAHLCHLLKPGGVLVTSAAENVSEHLTSLERIASWRHQNPQVSRTRTTKKGSAR